MFKFCTISYLYKSCSCNPDTFHRTPHDYSPTEYTTKTIQIEKKRNNLHQLHKVCHYFNYIAVVASYSSHCQAKGITCKLNKMAKLRILTGKQVVVHSAEGKTSTLPWKKRRTAKRKKRRTKSTCSSPQQHIILRAYTLFLTPSLSFPMHFYSFFSYSACLPLVL